SHLASTHHIGGEVAGAFDGESGDPHCGADDILHSGGDLATGLKTDELCLLGQLSHGIASVGAMAEPATGWSRLCGRLIVDWFGGTAARRIRHLSGPLFVKGEQHPVSFDGRSLVRYVRGPIVLEGYVKSRQVYDFSTATQGVVTLNLDFTPSRIAVVFIENLEAI
ncbi:MAG TPA: hypothetical protein VIJ16_10475, partial [Gemmatimonadaceae bacterium]